MSNQGLIIEERSRDIGGFMVGRLLPFRKKRMIGPFVFLDHMGPKRLQAGEKLDIGPHPHIGLSTLTYLFSGAVFHKDSLGSEQLITPGAVNWMTAGKGVVHSERTPDSLKKEERLLHGLQIWVAMPKLLENSEPSFHHIAEKDLPKWNEASISYTLVAGEAFGYKSPVPVLSPLFMLDIVTSEDNHTSFNEVVEGELGIYVLKGAIKACDELIESGHLLASKTDHNCAIHIAKGSRIIVFGGEPFPEERHIYWNFVSSDKEKLEEAKTKWINKAFPKVPGDEGYIPLPKF